MAGKREEWINLLSTLQEKYKENRERFTELRQRYYRIQCAWCQTHIRWRRKEVSTPCQISHGICAQCFARVSRCL
jgi:hypothetical protein